MFKDYETTVRALLADNKFIKDTYIGHSGYALLWFDREGYSVTEVSRNSAGTSGILTWEHAKQDFINTVTRLINKD